MKIAYKPRNLRSTTLELIQKASSIIEEYESRGFNLTLRQLFYRFVARGWLPNRQRSYKNLGNAINAGRMTGLISWRAIEDRTRSVRSNQHWDSPVEILEASRNSYQIDLWENQPYRPMVWIEKDALLDLISRPCQRLDVPYASCRGYTSQSMMWRAAMAMEDQEVDGFVPHLIYLGDHDPSGLDMPRDIEDRLRVFGVVNHDVERIALTMQQIRDLNPPPNPAKLSDSRASEYVAKYGRDSWELDALDPSYLIEIVEEAILRLRDEDLYQERLEDLRRDRGILSRAIDAALKAKREEEED